MKDSEVRQYVEYAHREKNAWSLVEKPILDYVFERFFKDRFLRSRFESGAITTKFGSTIPSSFSALDIAAGTGRVSAALIGYGVPNSSIYAVDREKSLLMNEHFPDGVHKVVCDVRKMSRLNEALYRFSGKYSSFDFAVANMVYHLMSYKDYLTSLKQVHRTLSERSLLLITVPHPWRKEIKSIGSYHQPEYTLETNPWGTKIKIYHKTIQEYERGLADAGFSTFYAATTGVGLKVDDRLLLSDEPVWSSIKAGAKGEEAHHFRLWLLAHKTPDWALAK